MTLVGTYNGSLPAAAPVAPTWRDRFGLWRDRLYASHRFRRLAGRLPGVRWVARARARALFDLVAGFAYTQTLTACVRLDLLRLVEGTPLSTLDIAGRLGHPVEPIERLARAAAALGLLERRGDRWGLGPLGAPLLATPGLAQMIEHNALLYDELQDPLRMLRAPAGRATALSRYWGYVDDGRRAGLGSADVSGYTALMSATVAPVADEVLDAVELSGARTLLDVGGGDGSFVAAVARRHPALRFGLFDLPAVAPHARRRLRDEEVDARVTVHQGDFQRDPLPRGHDVITLVRVCLDHDDSTVLALLRATREALAPGGRLVVAEPLSGVKGAEVVADAYFGWYLWAMGRGRARTADELRALMVEAGYRQVTVHPTRYPVQAGVLTGAA